jgi:hypothetical protein
MTASFGGTTVVIGDDENSVLKQAEAALAKALRTGAIA